MRIAIFSDIHSNLPALEEALKLCREIRTDAIFTLGDIVGYGAFPNECLDLVRENCSKNVLGNHEIACLHPSPKTPLPMEGEISAKWTITQLTSENKNFLESFKLKESTDILTLVHASPQNPASWEYISNLVLAKKQFEHFQTPLCFIGHTHVPSICGEDLRTFAVRKESRFLINVGSIGQPRDGNPELSFGFFDTETWTYENIRAPYDISIAAQAILDNNLPSSLAYRLFKGI